VTTVCLVPRRADGGRRDQVWAWVRDRWNREHPDITIREGTDDGPGKFNRSLAINRAAEAAGDWDTAVISDSDSFVGADQIRHAVKGATEGPCRFWLAYDQYNYLSRKMSDRIVAGYDGWWGANGGIEWSMTNTCSSMLVVTRELWDTVGGFDAGFEGWGFEDVAFSHACQTFGGGLQRIPGPVWHLHHPSSPENDNRSPEWEANRLRMIRYGDVSYDQPAMRALIDELHP
jgi:hypothetical protein